MYCFLLGFNSLLKGVTKHSYYYLSFKKLSLLFYHIIFSETGFVRFEVVVLVLLEGVLELGRLVVTWGQVGILGVLVFEAGTVGTEFSFEVMLDASDQILLHLCKGMYTP